MYQAWTNHSENNAHVYNHIASSANKTKGCSNLNAGGIKIYVTWPALTRQKKIF
ncbi:hypothetical protein HBA_0313 [Sodalis endosymbiont of Henestaris halophilus]|nr:hypothetical protein HBA_0313 [Sodalis endosymbiont of Henestaris halophilus]